jgi:hypothetical protein
LILSHLTRLEVGDGTSRADFGHWDANSSPGRRGGPRPITSLTTDRLVGLIWRLD